MLVEVWQVPLCKILQTWKGYTAKEANRILHRQGSLWEEDYFDRYIRDEEHLRRVVRYIENNPVKASLVHAAAEWPWSSARFRSPQGSILSHPTAQRVPEQP